MVVMKAMGMESDQEVVQMLGRDPRFSALLLPSIERSYADHGEVLYPSQGFSRKLTSFHALLLGSWLLLSGRDMYLTWECAGIGVYTKEQALAYLDTK
ncbi:hypothetical protein Goari_020860, partial [Gossypium aridum]|nr:hypothetical protein [Gossypium aridum]